MKMHWLKRASRRPAEIETSRKMNALRNDSGALLPLHLQVFNSYMIIVILLLNS